MSHLYPKRNFVPKAVLMKSSLKTLNTARQNSSRAAVFINTVRPINTAYTRLKFNSARPASKVFNRAHSHVRRPFNKFTTNKNSNLNEKFNTVKGNVTTIGSKAVESDNKGNEVNAIKASAYLKEKGVIDSGCSRHITGNKSYLSDYEEINGGFVAFGGNFKGYTECVVLSPDFKLLDESHVLLKVPRKDNMYSVDLKNVVPLGGIENLIDLRVKVIRCDNGTEFKNRVMNQFCEMKEAARTMLADSKLPITFWAEAVNTACYVQNRVLVIKPHNKTPYELFLGRKPALSFMRPFGCPVTILNTIDHLGKFDGKADEGFFVGYSTNSKAFRVFNSRTRIVEENLHVQFSKNTSNIAGSRPNSLFNIDALTNFMKYKPIVVGNQSNRNADPPFSSSLKDSLDVGFKPSGEEEKKDAEDPGNESGNLNKGKDTKVPSIEEPRINREKNASVNNTNNINSVSPTVNVASIEDNVVDENIVYGCADDPNISDLEEIGRFSDAEDDGAEADMTNLDTYIPISPIPTTRIYKDNPVEQIIRDIHSAPQTRRMTKSTKACDDVGKARMEIVPGKDYILLPLWPVDPLLSSSSKDSPDAGFKPSREEEKEDTEEPGQESGNSSKDDERVHLEKDASINSTNSINTVSSSVNAAGIKDNVVEENIVYGCADDPNMPHLEEIGRFSDAKDDTT
ncbi:ribonuclease H-like domain-containing protein [Tanacetum coccineum]